MTLKENQDLKQKIYRLNEKNKINIISSKLVKSKIRGDQRENRNIKNIK